jgi:hypothetical protein
LAAQPFEQRLSLRLLHPEPFRGDRTRQRLMPASWQKIPAAEVIKL